MDLRNCAEFARFSKVTLNQPTGSVGTVYKPHYTTRFSGKVRLVYQLLFLFFKYRRC